MFTGIIEEIGIIKSVQRGTRSSKISITAKKIQEDMKTGDSIHTNGACLTVISFTDSQFTADVMPETMNRSGLSSLIAGSRVNLERAVRLSDRLGGHIVSGHIDDTGTIKAVRRDENAIWLTITTGKKWLKYIVEEKDRSQLTGSASPWPVSMTALSPYRSFLIHKL